MCHPSFSISSFKPIEFLAEREAKAPPLQLMGVWDIASDQRVHLYSLANRKLHAFVCNKQDIFLAEVKEDHIRGGIQGQMPQEVLQRMLHEIAYTRLAAVQLQHPQKGLQLFFFPHLLGAMKRKKDEKIEKEKELETPTKRKREGDEKTNEKEESATVNEKWAKSFYEAAEEKQRAYQELLQTERSDEMMKALSKTMKKYERVANIRSSYQQEAKKRLAKLKPQWQRLRLEKEIPLYLADSKAQKSRLLKFLHSSELSSADFSNSISFATKEALADYFTRAFAYEALEEREQAALCYHQLAQAHLEKNNQAAADQCFKKAFQLNPQLLLRNNLIFPPHSDFLDAKSKQALIRMQFETLIEKIKGSSENVPSCFISYAWGLNPESTDWLTSAQGNVKLTQDWLTENLVADLGQLGLPVLFDLRECLAGTNVMNYMQKIATCDYVVLLCTPSMQKNYRKQQKGESICGIKTEMTLLNTRFRKEHLKDTVLSLLYQGEWEEASPLPMTDDTIYIDFRKPGKYYEACLALCCTLKNIPHRPFIKSFKQSVKAIINQREIEDGEKEMIQVWQQKRQESQATFWEPLLKKN